MIIRRLTDADGPAMLAFMQTVPVAEATFFKDEQITSPDVADWAMHADAIRLVAEDEDRSEIIGYIAVLPGVGMSSHTGEIRLVVCPAARRRGIGRGLARAAMSAGFAEARLSKLFVELLAEDEGIIQMFRKLGFKAEALLQDHIRDVDGRLRDLMVFAHFVEEGWSDIATLGIDEAL